MAKGSFAEQSARDNLSVRRERALLVGVLLNNEKIADETLQELAELARSAGAEVVDRTVQRRKSFNSATCVGKGKLAEIKQRADAYDANVIIFDNNLSPSQIREIEEATERKVLDRSELILDIFATRARTAEARLQVELAQLKYTAPRLRGMWTHLERIAGSAGAGGVGEVGGIGARGPGEAQLEIDRRIVDKRIVFLQRKLDEIDRRKVREVNARKEHYTVSLVGYTNSGKTTLMNALTGAGAQAEDLLFMTLDTLTRKWDLGGGRHTLLSDTVGFIRDLPHHLVASFHATLEETIHADLLLHVVDAANPQVLEQIEAVHAVLKKLGAGEKPVLMLLNKIDAVKDQAMLTVIQGRHPDALLISAKTGLGLETLRAAVDTLIQGDQRDLTLSLAAGDGKALNFLERFAEVLDRTYEDARVVVRVRIPPRALEHLHTIAKDVRHV
jgi:GTPase